MAHGQDSSEAKVKAPRVLALAAAVSGVALALPSAGLAVGSIGESAVSLQDAALEVFTPATVDPELAARVAGISDAKGFRFTPAGAHSIEQDRVVTVAVRVDQGTANAINVRKIVEALPSARPSGISTIRSSRYDLGTARGYKSFARQVELPKTVRDLSMPDLADYEPAGPTAVDEPSRLQPRISVEGESIAGRSPNTLDALESQTVDVGGSFSLAPNLDVTAGVRLSQERDRLAPLTNSQQDSQAVYVGTQIKF